MSDRNTATKTSIKVMVFSQLFLWTKSAHNIGMQNFRINPPGYSEPEQAHHWYDVGAKVLFVKFVTAGPQPIAVAT